MLHIGRRSSESLDDAWFGFPKDCGCPTCMAPICQKWHTRPSQRAHCAIYCRLERRLAWRSRAPTESGWSARRPQQCSRREAGVRRARISCWAPSYANRGEIRLCLPGQSTRAKPRPTRQSRNAMTGNAGRRRRCNRRPRIRRDTCVPLVLSRVAPGSERPHRQGLSETFPPEKQSHATTQPLQQSEPCCKPRRAQTT